MKAIIIILTIILLLTNEIVGQHLTYGIKGGMDIVNFKWVSSFPENFSQKLSYNFGVILNYKIVEKISLQIEPGFIEKGSQSKFKRQDKPYLYEYGYLNLPLVLIVNPLKRLNIEFGPEFGYLKYSRKTNPSGSIFSKNDPIDKHFEVAATFGLSYNVFTKGIIMVRYSLGLTPLQNNVILADPGPSIPYKIFNRYAEVGLRIIINKHKDKPALVRSRNDCLVLKRQKKHIFH